MRRPASRRSSAARAHIAQAHKPDEWIAQSQLDACDAFVRRLGGSAARLIAGPMEAGMRSQTGPGQPPFPQFDVRI